MSSAIEIYGSRNEVDVEEQLLAETRQHPTSEQERKQSADVDRLLDEMPLTEDITCGYWIFKGSFFQRFANQTSYVVLYGLVGCILGMSYAYFNGTITTIEKRFKIPSQNTGIISIGNNISQMFLSAIISYYAGKGHRPRWIGFGIMTIVLFCWMTAAPHFVYGPGDDALSLTLEYGKAPDENATLAVLETEHSKGLCKLNAAGNPCEVSEGNFAPQVVLFSAQLISGIGSALYYTLGVSYMDDNTKKSQSPALLSISYCIHMLGPAAGYAVASLFLRIYIAPQLTPFIDAKDPRWLGAWWMGWLVTGGLLFFFGIIVSLFPKELPRAMARRMVETARKRKEQSTEKKEHALANNGDDEEEEDKASFGDMMLTFKRLLRNKTFMYNNISSVFYYFGYIPYWIFTPKYIEIQYRQSASTSSMVTGTVALGFSALGVLLSGLVISKYKPRARYLAAWNVLCGFLTVAGILAYLFIGCPGNEQSVIVNIHDSSVNSSATCNSMCNCDYVRYSPVCGENNMTYISPCHAGCSTTLVGADGRKTFSDCSCIPSGNSSTNDYDLFAMNWETASTASNFTGGSARTGSCPVDCMRQFITFLAVMCFLKFIFSAARASNFLVSVRCVSEKDKTAAMGFGMFMVCLLTFIPAPVFFGWLLDSVCLVWGKTCTDKGNCWLYDPVSLRYTLNLTAAVFIFFGTIFDCGVWYYVKNLKIFDDEVKEEEMKPMNEQKDNQTKLAKNEEK